MLSLLILATIAAPLTPSPTLQELYAGHRYFELRDALKAEEPAASSETLFFQGIVDNRFGLLDRSIQEMTRYLKGSRSAAERDRRLDAEGTLADDYRKEFRYKESADTYKRLAETLSKDEQDRREDYTNEEKLLASLRDVPPQRVVLNGESRLHFKQSVGLQVPVVVGGKTETFVFDTGANFSVASVTDAHRLGIRIFDVPIQVGGVTGQDVTAHMGVGPEFAIGKATISNAIFLVMSDKDLEVAPGVHLKPILGFPVISALREFTMTREGEIIIPARPGRMRGQNLCLDGLYPIIDAVYEGRHLSFCLDSGANRTTLYPPFFKAFHDEILATGTKTTEKVTGVGSSKDVPAYRLANFTFQIGGQEAHLPGVMALTEPTLDHSNYYYGNLGQDLMRQFDSMTINFDAMNLEFHRAK